MIDKKSAALLNCVHGDGRITGAPPDATKGLNSVGVGFGSDQLAVGRSAPEVGAAGVEKGASKGAEGADELAGIVALERGPGKLKKQLLESLVRLRRASGDRISSVGSQCAPFA